MARPTIYDDEIIRLAEEYRDIPRPNEEEVIPSIEGLSLHLHVNRDTIYEWRSQEDKKEFSDIVGEILAIQGQTLINQGLKGVFNQSITKVMMTKHGYREGIEQTGKDGEKLDLGVVILPQKNNENTMETPAETGTSSS